MMKIFVALFIIIPVLAEKNAAGTQEELIARIDGYHKECSKISNVDPQVLTKARQGDVDLNNEALSKHILCFTKKGELTNDNDLQRPVIKAKLEAQLKDFDVQKVMDSCDASVKKEGDFALYVTQLVACYYKHLPKNAKIL